MREAVLAQAEQAIKCVIGELIVGTPSPVYRLPDGTTWTKMGKRNHAPVAEKDGDWVVSGHVVAFHPGEEVEVIRLSSEQA